MSKVLISAIYDGNPIVLCLKKFDIQKLFLLVDKNPDDKQKDSIKRIKDLFKDFVEIKEVKSEIYDIVDTAKQTVKILDSIPEDEEVFVNITCGRKTQCLGLNYGVYARPKKVSALVYVTEEDKKILYLPKIGYDLTSSQRNMLELFKSSKLHVMTKFAEKLELSTSIVYKNYQILIDKGLILKTKEGVELTDFGRLALL